MSSWQAIGTQQVGLDFPQWRKHSKIILQCLTSVKWTQNMVQMKSFSFTFILIAMTVY